MMNKQNVPELRFPEFSGEWDKRKLNEISDKVREKNKDMKISETLTNSAQFGIVSQRDYFDKDISSLKSLSNYYVVKPDDFVYNPRISKHAPVGPVKRNKLNRLGVMSPLYYVFRTKDVDKEFLEYYFEATKWHKFMYFNGDTGARSDRFSIKDSVFQTMDIPYPEEVEQRKIGNLFKKIDRLIELEEKKLELLEEQKKGYMQKIFSQELRFKDENGNEYPEWEEKLWKDIGEYQKSYSYSRAYEGDGSYKHIHYGDIHTKLPLFIDDSNLLPNIEVSGNLIVVEKGDLIIADASEDYKDLGKVAVFMSEEPNVISGLHTIRFRPIKGFDSQFLSYYTQTEPYRKFIAKMGTGVSVLGISKKNLDKIKLEVPSLDEQEKIGKFLKKNDEIIEMRKNKILILKRRKKGLAQRMFV